MPPRDKTHLFLSDKHLSILMGLLKQHVPDAAVWVYGSRVTGNAHSGSDLDLVLRNPINLTQRALGYHDLKEALQDSLLPMLVDLHQWADLPSSFHRNIEQAYIILASPS